MIPLTVQCQYTFKYYMSNPNVCNYPQNKNDFHFRNSSNCHCLHFSGQQTWVKVVKKTPSQTDSEHADVDPSLAAVADYLVFGQAQAQAWAQAQAQTWAWAERGPSEPIRPKAAQQHAPRHPKC